MASIPTNVIIFGESGSGKSSLVNMLSDDKVAPISNGIGGCTTESTGYEVDILGRQMTLWDTAGLDEGEAGRVPNMKAITNLYSLFRNVETGINLLVFVTRPRIKDSAQRNWKLFYEIICRKKVPIVVVVTGLEGQTDMERWWTDNKGDLQNYDIHPDDHACITTSRGKKRNGRYIFEEEFEESRAKVLNLLRWKCAKKAWRVPRAEWFEQIVDNTWKRWLVDIVFRRGRDEGKAQQQLINVCGMSREEADYLAIKMSTVDLL